MNLVHLLDAKVGAVLPRLAAEVNQRILLGAVKHGVHLILTVVTGALRALLVGHVCKGRARHLEGGKGRRLDGGKGRHGFFGECS